MRLTARPAAKPTTSGPQGWERAGRIAGRLAHCGGTATVGRMSSTSRRRHTPRRCGTANAGTRGAHRTRGTAQPPVAESIIHRLVFALEGTRGLRADTMLAATAAVLCMDHDGVDGQSFDDHLHELAARDDVTEVLRGVLDLVALFVWNGAALVAPLVDALDGEFAATTARRSLELLAQTRVGDFVAGRDPHAADLLGTLYTETRPSSARKAAGAFYTPASVALMMAEMLDIEEGKSILDPAVGTGGMFLAAARAMRRAGRRPHRCMWTGIDVDARAIACAAVNGVAWMLGPFVRLVVGNALTFDISTFPADDDPSFLPVLLAWNLRALATRDRCSADHVASIANENGPRVAADEA